MAQVQCVFQRYEKKYILNSQQYLALTHILAPYVEDDAYGQYTICSLYFDTPDFQIVRESLRKPVYKEKLRLRSYGVPGELSQVFVELKKKYKGVVYKRRVQLPYPQAKSYLEGAWRPRQSSQILREIDYYRAHYPLLAPRALIAYDRQALTGKEDGRLRITFDTRIRGRSQELELGLGDHGRLLLPPEQYLMEVKVPHSLPLWLCRGLDQIGVYPASFSKYGYFYCNILQKEQENTAFGGQKSA